MKVQVLQWTEPTAKETQKPTSIEFKMPQKAKDDAGCNVKKERKCSYLPLSASSPRNVSNSPLKLSENLFILIVILGNISLPATDGTVFIMRNP